MNKIVIVCILCFIGFISCEHNKKPYIIINLGNTINDKGPNSLKLNDISESVKLIPIETNDSLLLPIVYIAGTTKDSIIVHDKKSVYCINKENGRVFYAINRYGDGPEEYKFIFDAFLNKRKKTICIYDPTKKAILEYTFDGTYLTSLRNDSIGFFRILNDGCFAVSYSPFSNTGFALGIYDDTWNLKRKGIPKKKDREFDMAHFDDIAEFNNEHYYKLSFCDTLYRILPDLDEPYLVVLKGKYKIPVEIAASLSESDKHGHKYIQQDYGYLISKYFFLRYYYDRRVCYEIWDTENSTLIYKNRYGQDGGNKGVPVVIDGKEFFVWPIYVSGNFLYCTIEDDDATSLMPSLPSDTNPIILEVNINK